MHIHNTVTLVSFYELEPRKTSFVTGQANFFVARSLNGVAWDGNETNETIGRLQSAEMTL